MQTKFEENNLRQVDVWLYSTSNTSIEFIDFSKSSPFWESEKNNSKFNLAGYLEGKYLSLLERIQKVVYPPVFLGEKSIKVRSFNKNVVYGHFEINALTTALNMVRKGFFIEKIPPSNTCCWNTYCCFGR